MYVLLTDCYTSVHIAITENSYRDLIHDCVFRDKYNDFYRYFRYNIQLLHSEVCWVLLSTLIYVCNTLKCDLSIDSSIIYTCYRLKSASTVNWFPPQYILVTYWSVLPMLISTMIHACYVPRFALSMVCKYRHNWILFAITGLSVLFLLIIF